MSYRGHLSRPACSHVKQVAKRSGVENPGLWHFTNAPGYFIALALRSNEGQSEHQLPKSAHIAIATTNQRIRLQDLASWLRRDVRSHIFVIGSRRRLRRSRAALTVLLLFLPQRGVTRNHSAACPHSTPCAATRQPRAI